MQTDLRLPLVRVFLVGFMGAGKSTIGPLAAAKLGWGFADADRAIEGITGLTIAELFSRYGEAEFRKLETEAVAGLHSQRHVVLALGGGALESEATRLLLTGSNDSCVVYLKAPFSTLLERCDDQDSSGLRPILQDRAELAARYESRLRYYEEAHMTVETSGVSPNDAAADIVSQLAERYSLPSLNPIETHD